MSGRIAGGLDPLKKSALSRCFCVEGLDDKGNTSRAQWNKRYLLGSCRGTDTRHGLKNHHRQSHSLGRNAEPPLALYGAKRMKARLVKQLTRVVSFDGINLTCRQSIGSNWRRCSIWWMSDFWPVHAKTRISDLSLPSPVTVDYLTEYLPAEQV